MPGLVPASTSFLFRYAKTWMARTSPAMTTCHSEEPQILRATAAGDDGVLDREE
jgi:hypothetical protein